VPWAARLARRGAPGAPALEVDVLARPAPAPVAGGGD